MAWDGNGSFTRTNGTQTGATTWANSRDAGNDILASQHDTHDQDLADGINACLTKNNETKPTISFKPNADNSIDLGSNGLRWRRIYVGEIRDTNDNELLKFSVTSSAVNELTVANAATGNRPLLSATGGDTDIGLALRPKGTGAGAGVVIEDGNGNEVLIGDVATASAVNEVTLTNAATGKSPTFTASGGDSNITLTLKGKGTGGVSAPIVGLVGIIGGKLAFSVGSSALTVAIKTHAGNDPSSAEPVFVMMRSATADDATLTVMTLTAATSVVVSSGSKLGTVDGIAFRIWVVGFNDAGTFRLGVINCLAHSAGAGAGRDVSSIYPLSGWAIASSTAEGGAGAADSAQTFYTGSAVASKPYAVLGHATWESGLGTAGTWSAGPTRAQMYALGAPLPGQSIQRQRSQSGGVATGTTEIPNDDTIPQNTEGDQYLTQAITPSSAANVLRNEVHLQGACSLASTNSVIALFQDSTANALAVSEVPTTDAAANSRFIGIIKNDVLALTTSATTMKVRYGAITGTGGTNTVNGAATARLYGGTICSYLQIDEVMG